MRFHYQDDYFELSECGHYTVATIHLGSVIRYEAYRKSLIGKPSKMIGARKTQRGARAVCERHERKLAAVIAARSTAAA